ncbi:MAG: DNA cytosine methyltransferase [Nitrososphaerales archaeon]
MSKNPMLNTKQSVRPEENWDWAKWVQLKQPLRKNFSRAPKLRLVDLFCGCGGLTLGVAEACRQLGFNLDIALAVDFSHEALDVYRENFSVDEKVARRCDIRKLITGRIGNPLTFDERRLRKEIGVVDFLVAGPPCQGHSNLNNVSRRDDPRNRLYTRAGRAAEIFMPQFVLIENVPSVIHDSSGAVRKTRARLEEIGYSVWDGVVSLADYGVPQTRKRHILLASKLLDISSGRFVFPVNKVHVPIKSFISGLESEPLNCEGIFFKSAVLSRENKKRIDFLFERKLFDLPNFRRPPCHRKEHSYKSMYGRMYWDRPAQTITSGFGSMGQGRFVHPLKRRTITAHEAARIQGFPDFFSFRNVKKLTSLREMIGNAVPPQLAATLVYRLFQT